jgi:hypothetical protein
MALPSSGSITLQQIQSEYSVSGLQAASTAAGLNPLPTAMRDFMGLSSASAYLDSTYYWDSMRDSQDESIIQAFVVIDFLTDGRLQITQGTNEFTAVPFINGGQWLSTSPGTVSAAVAQGWDLELTKVSGPADGIFTYNLQSGGYREVTNTGSDWGTRYQLGVNAPYRNLLITIAPNGPYMWDETLIFTAKIYLHGTNTLVAQGTFELYVKVSSLAPI